MSMERALLVAANLNDGEDYLASLQELGDLAEAAGMEVAGTITQALEAVHKAFYIGTGKVDEVKALAAECDADVIIFDNALSPMQLRNLNERLELPILDRSVLILDIFASRARSREAKLQVEAARLQYTLPRLVGLHAALSRQGGASGSQSSRGAGEKKLELDRRVLEKRLTELRRELKEVEGERKTQRQKRVRSGLPRVALVGYTNAGKSTLLNAMLERYGAGDEEKKQVFEKDMLFATLDTTVRRIAPPERHAFLLSDTVGFLHKLPHHLVEAFRSTLEEAGEADLLLQVADCSNPRYREQIEVTNRTLKQLGAAGIPMIYVYNKADLAVEAAERAALEENLQETSGHAASDENMPETFGHAAAGTNLSKMSCHTAAGADLSETSCHALSRDMPEIGKAFGGDTIYISAKRREGLEELLDLIEEKLSGGYRECTLLIPYADGRAVSYLNENAVVSACEYLEEGVRMRVNCKKADYGYYEKYALGSDSV